MAVGFRAALEVTRLLGIQSIGDEELVCVTENDACGIDAIQYMLSCTVSKGNLIFDMKGKNAYTFFRRRDGRGLRMVLKSWNRDEMTKEESKAFILSADFDDLYEVMELRIQMPTQARNFTSYPCGTCGESVAENYIRINEGQ